MVGLSANWYRPSFFAAKYLQDHGYEIIPVNPNYQEILGETCYPHLKSIPGSVDVVQVFQRSNVVLPIARAAIGIGAKVLWLQIGVVDKKAAKLASDAGLDVVMDKCIKIEHARILGGLNFIGIDTGIISSHRVAGHVRNYEPEDSHGRS